mmetsp:Transcript_91943/g.201522  ORF Transcript_91943/g.201522 Transcript_91943/m.201522 type:complete len:209 (+) Transcript_91943:383-1009(+)
MIQTCHVSPTALANSSGSLALSADARWLGTRHRLSSGTRISSRAAISISCRSALVVEDCWTLLGTAPRAHALVPFPPSALKHRCHLLMTSLCCKVQCCFAAAGLDVHTGSLGYQKEQGLGVVVASSKVHRRNRAVVALIYICSSSDEDVQSLHVETTHRCRHRRLSTTGCSSFAFHGAAYFKQHLQGLTMIPLGCHIHQRCLLIPRVR